MTKNLNSLLRKGGSAVKTILATSPTTGKDRIVKQGSHRATRVVVASVRCKEIVQSSFNIADRRTVTTGVCGLGFLLDLDGLVLELDG